MARLVRVCGDAMSARALMTRAAHLVMAERGWTQESLGRRLGMTGNAVSRKMLGYRSWSEMDLDRLAGLLADAGIGLRALPEREELERWAAVEPVSAVCGCCGREVVL